MPKQLSFFLPNLAGGGAERMIVNLSNEIASRGYRVDLVLLATEGPYLSEVTNRVEVIDLEAPEWPGYAAMGGAPRLRSYIREERPDALLSALTRTNVVALLAHRLSGVSTRLVVSERNHLSSVTEHYDDRRMRILPWLVRRTYPWADAIVPISYGVARDLSSLGHIPLSEMEVIHNPAYSEEIPLKADEPLDHPWFRSPEPVILGVGSLTKQKDFLTLIRGFRELRSSVDARLVILGEGEGREKLERVVREQNLEEVVDLPGFVDNPFKYMAHADVFVLSSRWEGFGNVVVEALACGTPVVSTDCPSGPAEILADGEYGRLVPVADPNAIADAVRETLAEPSDEEALRRRAREFNVAAIADEYLAVMLRQN